MNRPVRIWWALSAITLFGAAGVHADGETLNTTQHTVSTPDTSRATYAIVASGSVQGAITDPHSEQPATGSLGVQHVVFRSTASHPNVWEQRATILFSAVSSSDTLRTGSASALAAAILNPSAGKPGAAEFIGLTYESLWEYSQISHQKGGVFAYVTHSNGPWRRDSTAADASPIVEVANEAITSFGVGGEWMALNVPSDRDGNSLTFTFGAGYAGRFVHSSGTAAAALRRRVLGTTDRSFQGLELTSRLEVRQLSAVARIPILRGLHKEDVEGLTGPQLSVEFKLEAPLMLLRTEGYPAHKEQRGKRKYWLF